MLKIILCFLLFFLPHVSKAGYIEYYNTINEGEFHMYEGHYHIAIDNFIMAFDLVETPKARDYFLAAKCYSQLNKELPMLKYLELTILGGLDKSFIEDDSLWFTSFRHSHDFKSILKLKPEQAKSKLDKESTSAFKSLSKNFKLVKLMKHYESYETKDSLPKKFEKNLETYIPYRDSLRAELIHYLCHFSFPSDQKKLMKLGLISFFFLTNDLPNIDSVKAIVISRIDSGIVEPMDFVDFFDNLMPNEYELGTLTKSNYGTIYSLVPQHDFMNVLENRKRIGLSIYYVDAPNYSKNYKPLPISNIIQPENLKFNEEN